jgi:peroxiredoxin Q/BCP
MSKKSRVKSTSGARGNKQASKSPAAAKAKAGKAGRATAAKPAKATAARSSAKVPSTRSKSQTAGATTARKTEKAPPVKSSAGKPASLAEGVKAPAFQLPRDGGATVSLADFHGKKLVLFFYPRADTPGCTREAIDFTRLNDAFAKAGTAILGISADSPKAQEKFRDKHGLSVPLISDEQHEMLQAYGAWGEKSMYGKTFLGIIRTTVLVDADGRVARVWRNVKVDGHADEVLAAAQAL